MLMHAPVLFSTLAHLINSCTTLCYLATLTRTCTITIRTHSVHDLNLTLSLLGFNAHSTFTISLFRELKLCQSFTSDSAYFYRHYISIITHMCSYFIHAWILTQLRKQNSFRSSVNLCTVIYPTVTLPVMYTCKSLWALSITVTSHNNISHISCVYTYIFSSWS